MESLSHTLLYALCISVNIDDGFSYWIRDVNCLDKSTEKHDEGGSCHHLKPKFEVLDDNLREVSKLFPKYCSIHIRASSFPV